MEPNLTDYPLFPQPRLRDLAISVIQKYVATHGNLELTAADLLKVGIPWNVMVKKLLILFSRPWHHLE